LDLDSPLSGWSLYDRRGGVKNANLLSGLLLLFVASLSICPAVYGYLDPDCYLRCITEQPLAPAEDFLPGGRCYGNDPRVQERCKQDGLKNAEYCDEKCKTQLPVNVNADCYQGCLQAIALNALSGYSEDDCKWNCRDRGEHRAEQWKPKEPDLPSIPTVPPSSAVASQNIKQKSESAFDAKSLFKKVKDSVVMVVSYDSMNKPLSMGSGFYVGNGDAVATNLHVIEKACALEIKSLKGSVIKIEYIVGIDREHDVVLLATPVRGMPLKLANRTPEIGEKIIAIGNPKGLEGTLSDGIVSGVRGDGQSTYYQITAPISQGSSGGPVLNDKGEVLGISSFFVKEGQNLNFAMPAEYIQQLLRSQDKIKVSQVPSNAKTEAQTQTENTEKLVCYCNGVQNIFDVDFASSTVRSAGGTKRAIIKEDTISWRTPESAPYHGELAWIIDRYTGSLTLVLIEGSRSVYRVSGQCYKVSERQF
jgi:hypothetical protein